MERPLFPIGFSRLIYTLLYVKFLLLLYSCANGPFSSLALKVLFNRCITPILFTSMFTPNTACLMVQFASGDLVDRAKEYRMPCYGD